MDIHNIPETEIDVNIPFTSSSLPQYHHRVFQHRLHRPQKKRKNLEDHHLDKAFGLLTAAASVTNSDEQQNFGNLVANKLKKYWAGTQNAIQHAWVSF
ncbi:unnamed protein product [Macrosiphum euphorbiae]|uniref:Uncharacterized protein n=1 Tax=Macrosiphum euphorbiae TaxID=13131 RepID=A0AAV0VQ59_9HEMI|nr:unnamed protein product [Macrosiphum euphorbiae]